MSILVFGGHGFLGKHVVKALGDRKVAVPTSRECNFQSPIQIYDKIVELQPDYIINLVGWNGGIKFNLAHPIEIFNRNTELNLHFFKAIYEYIRLDRANLKKVITPITSCAYPDVTDLKEESFWDGPVHCSVECHGVARRTIEVQSRLLNKWSAQNLKHPPFLITPCLNNLYGPGDNFDDERSKFFAAIVKKIVNAREDTIQMYGSGMAKREPLYVGDAANHLVWLLDNYDSANHNLINISGDEEISIRELADMIAEEAGYRGQLVWESDTNDGQATKKLNVDFMKSLGMKNSTSLKEGIRETIKWYKYENRTFN